MCVPGKLFQPSVMFEGKAGAYLPLEGRLVALSTNIRLGWKHLPGTNKHSSLLLKS